MRRTWLAVTRIAGTERAALNRFARFPVAARAAPRSRTAARCSAMLPGPRSASTAAAWGAPGRGVFREERPRTRATPESSKTRGKGRVPLRWTVRHDRAPYTGAEQCRVKRAANPNRSGDRQVTPAARFSARRPREPERNTPRPSARVSGPVRHRLNRSVGSWRSAAAIMQSCLVAFRLNTDQRTHTRPR